MYHLGSTLFRQVHLLWRATAAPFSPFEPFIPDKYDKSPFMTQASIRGDTGVACIPGPRRLQARVTGREREGERVCVWRNTPARGTVSARAGSDKCTDYFFFQHTAHSHSINYLFILFSAPKRSRSVVREQKQTCSNKHCMSRGKTVPPAPPAAAGGQRDLYLFSIIIPFLQTLTVQQKNDM